MVKVFSISVDDWVWNTLEHRLSEKRKAGITLTRSAYVGEMIVKGLLVVEKPSNETK